MVPTIVLFIIRFAGNGGIMHIKFAGNRDWVLINMLAIVRNVLFFNRFRTIEALFIIEESPCPLQQRFFWKNVKSDSILFWIIAEFTLFLLWKNAERYVGKKNIALH